jgi:hypothetical protein
VRMAYAVHIVAGGVSLLAGFVALYSTKGATVHRRSGMLFVYAMLAMAGMGAAIAAVGRTEGSVIAGVTTCYLVITALTTVRRPAWWSPRLDVALMLLALGVGLTSLALGFVTLASPTGKMDGLPPFPFFMFGVVGLLGAAGDVRTIRAGGLTGSRRIARHLWRMTWALWVATSSFFLGQAKVIPKPVRIPALLALPVLAVLVTLLYWLWRVRVRQVVRGIVRAGAPGGARVDPGSSPGQAPALTVRS